MKMTPAEIHHVATVEGCAKGKAVHVEPMVVVGFGGGVVEDGICGMAYVKIVATTPEGRALVKYLKAEGTGFKSSMGTGWMVPCHLYNQSFTRKRAWCDGYAAVLRNNNVVAHIEEWIN